MYENTSKESQEHIFDNISSVRPLPADLGHESDLQNQEKSSKNRQKCDFSKIDILFHSGRKYDIWPEIGPLDTGKPPESLY